MPKACSECGANCTKTKGTYRDLCPDCLDDKAEQIRQKNTPHVERCDETSCLICHSKLSEMQEVIQPLYVHILLSKPNAPNATLTQYQ